MNAGRFLLQSLKFHWRANLSVLLGTAVGAAVLVGALAVGDGVRYSLKKTALARVGRAELVYFSPERLFRAELAQKTEAQLQTPVAPALLLRGTVEGNPADPERPPLRVGDAQVIGVRDDFWKFAPVPPASAPVTESSDGAAINAPLAARLGLKVGDDVTVGVVKPSLLSRDAPLSTLEDSYLTLRLPIRAIVGEEGYGRFSLTANQVPPLSVFVGLKALQTRLGQAGRANLLLAASRLPASLTPREATPALWKGWELTDSGSEAAPAPLSGGAELRTERIFLEPSLAEKIGAAFPSAEPVLTYFVNALRTGTRTTPYSTVSALPPSLLPAPLQDNEILLNTWLAQDLNARPGDKVTLRYWTMGDRRKLVENTADFRVRGVVPLTGIANDPTLMPSIPGLSDKKNCRDWEPGVPIDLNQIRPKDQTYWTKHRGTPKAFLTLASGRRLWNNRFGNTTAFRFPGESVSTLSEHLKAVVTPATLGVTFTPFRTPALAASEGGFNFGALFLGFSSFLIVSALLLTVMLFNFNIERRAQEIGTLLALGIPAGKVRNLLSYEGSLLAFGGAVLGTGLGLLYTRAVIWGLTGVWSGAVGGAILEYHVEPRTIGYGLYTAFEAAAVALWLASLRAARGGVSRLLNGQIVGKPARQTSAPDHAARPGRWTALFGIAGGLLLTLVGLKQNAEAGAETFFMAGSALLLGFLGVSRLLLETAGKSRAGAGFTLLSLALRGASRRVGRSLGAVVLFASGTFMVIAVGANQKRVGAEASRRDSGTGGFAFFARTTLPVYTDLNAASVQRDLGMETAALRGVSFVPFRTKPGDDASCLNLNRAQAPTLLGVNPAELLRRHAFTFTSVWEKAPAKPGEEWELLSRPQRDGTVPVIGDQNTVTWALGKKLGDVISYADEKGEPFRLKIVGVIENSVLQGGLILSEANFLARFPSRAGFETFLIDAPPLAPNLPAALSEALKESGLDLVLAKERLSAFGVVENTYLLIFMALGGLGLLLGSVGLGVVTLRNLLERRAELALLRAVGFTTRAIHRMVILEHVWLLGLGAAAGTLAALVAVLPAVQQKTLAGSLPFLGGLLLGVLLNGTLWTAAAAGIALRASPVLTLRDET